MKCRVLTESVTLLSGVSGLAVSLEMDLESPSTCNAWVGII